MVGPSQDGAKTARQVARVGIADPRRDDHDGGMRSTRSRSSASIDLN
jgi:hypothetical protein